MMGYLLGIDGGGTKTIGVLADRSGRVLARAVSGPGNYLKVGLPAVERSFTEIIHGVLDEAGVDREARIDGLCAGLAGADRPRDRRIIRALFRRLVGTRVILTENDARITLVGATEGRPGLIVIAGTGSVAMGMNRAGELARAGGWGHLIGDEGSGYDIGRRAMIAALHSYDGRSRKTLLEPTVVKTLRLRKIEDLVTRVYSRGMAPDEVAALFPRVVEAAQKGDGIARHLLEDAGRDLAATAGAVIRRLRMERTAAIVALSGGVFRARGPLYDAFCTAVRAVAPNAQITEPKHPPEIGAVALARARLERISVAQAFEK